jgi:hypothetical protein
MKAVLFLLICLTPSAARATQTGDHRVPDDMLVERYHLRGKVATKNPGNLEISISARNLSGKGESVMMVAYTARDSVEFASIHVDDWVTGDLVVNGKKTYVENLRVMRGHEFHRRSYPPSAFDSFRRV